MMKRKSGPQSLELCVRGGRIREILGKTSLERLCPDSRRRLLLILSVCLTLIFVPFVQTDQSRILQTTVSPVADRVIGEKTVPSQTKDPRLEQIQHQHKEIKDKYQNDFLSHSDIFCFDQFEYKNQDEKNSVKNRLKANFKFWKNIGACDFVLEVIKNGYSIPFISTPPSSFSKNNKSANENEKFVTGAIKDLVDSGCITCVSKIPFVVNPLSVSTQKSGKKRLILDLRKVNKHIWKGSLKTDYFEKNNFMFKFDLKSGYHHFDIAIEFQKYFFCWQENYYVFSVLPFGLSSAPFLFTKCLRPLVKYWRSAGINIVLYLDDGWGINGDYNSCLNDVKLVKETLIKAGFLINEEKSVWNPCTCLTWLGIVWDSNSFEIKIPESRLADLVTSIKNVYSDLPCTTSRTIAKVTGRIISMSPVLGNITRIMTRYMYMFINERKSWDSRMHLTDQNVISELNVWFHSVQNLNLRKLTQYVVPSFVMCSDASDFACGSISFDGSAFHKMWSLNEKDMSSTWRELKTIELTLDCFKEKLYGKAVTWYTDNQNCVLIINSGSMKLHLHKLAISILNLCLINLININIQWIPRNKNVEADMVSKIFDYDDWGVSWNFLITSTPCLVLTHVIDSQIVKISNLRSLTPDFIHQTLQAWMHLL